MLGDRAVDRCVPGELCSCRRVCLCAGARETRNAGDEATACRHGAAAAVYFGLRRRRRDGQPLRPGHVGLGRVPQAPGVRVLRREDHAAVQRRPVPHGDGRVHGAAVPADTGHGRGQGSLGDRDGGLRQAAQREQHVGASSAPRGRSGCRACRSSASTSPGTGTAQAQRRTCGRARRLRPPVSGRAVPESEVHLRRVPALQLHEDGQRSGAQLRPVPRHGQQHGRQFQGLRRRQHVGLLRPLALVLRARAGAGRHSQPDGADRQSASGPAWFPASARAAVHGG